MSDDAEAAPQIQQLQLDKRSTPNYEEKRLKQSADYLAMAVAQGNIIAMRNLGWYYRDGIGIPQDAVKAKKFLSQAANQGDAVAQEYLDQLGE